jgi:hypothetical protein
VGTYEKRHGSGMLGREYGDAKGDGGCEEDVSAL